MPEYENFLSCCTCVCLKTNQTPFFFSFTIPIPKKVASFSLFLSMHVWLLVGELRTVDFHRAGPSCVLRWGVWCRLRPDYRSQRQRGEPSSHPSSSPAAGAADAKATGASAVAATSSMGPQKNVRRRRHLTADRPQLDCPRCGSSHTRFRRFKGGAGEKPEYSCDSCGRGWSRGATLRQRKEKPRSPSAPHPLPVAPATRQASHAAAVDVAAAAAAGLPAEPPSEGDGLECSLGSAFFDWVDQFLQTRMQEDFRAAYLGGSEKRDGCTSPSSPSDGDQEPEHKLRQQQPEEQRPPLLWKGDGDLF